QAARAGACLVFGGVAAALDEFAQSGSAALAARDAVSLALPFGDDRTVCRRGSERDVGLVLSLGLGGYRGGARRRGGLGCRLFPLRSDPSALVFGPDRGQRAGAFLWQRLLQHPFDGSFAESQPAVLAPRS